MNCQVLFKIIQYNQYYYIRRNKKMDNSALNHIYYCSDGGICENIQESNKYKRKDDKCYNLYNKLLDSLNDEQKEDFKNFYDIRMELEYEAGYVRFKEGVKFGMRLAAECLI